MKSPLMAAVMAATMLAALAGTARADDGAQAKADLTKRLYAGEIAKGKKSYACFVRKYDAVHLAKHPKQKVAAMKLLLTAEADAEAGQIQHSFRMGVTFRNKPGNFETGGSCGYPDMSDVEGGKLRLGCGVDCDGGGISAEPAAADNKSVIVRLERVAIWDSSKPDSEERTSLSAGADDAVFRLDRASLDECKSLINDKGELAAMVQAKLVTAKR